MKKTVFLLLVFFTLLISVLEVTAPAPTTLAGGLTPLAYYSFDNSANLGINDYNTPSCGPDGCPTGNEGKIKGAAFFNYPQRFEFTGSGTNGQFALGPQFTILFWIKFPAGAAINEQDIVLGSITGTSPDQKLYFKDRRLTFYHGGRDKISGGTITAGDWHHYAISSDSGHNLQIYMDGSSTNSVGRWDSRTARAGVRGADGPFWITSIRGGRGGGGWNAALDELYIFDKVLTTEEIQTIYSYSLLQRDYPAGNLNFVKDKFNGEANPGEIDITCPSGNDANCHFWNKNAEGTIVKRETLSIQGGIATGTDSGAAGPPATKCHITPKPVGCNYHGYVMYSPEDIHSRFSGYAQQGNNFIAICQRQGLWYYDNNDKCDKFISSGFDERDTLLAFFTAGDGLITRLEDLKKCNIIIPAQCTTDEMCRELGPGWSGAGNACQLSIPEVCNNNIDDDRDAQIDCADSDCNNQVCGTDRKCISQICTYPQMEPCTKSDNTPGVGVWTYKLPAEAQAKTDRTPPPADGQMRRRIGCCAQNQCVNLGGACGSQIGASITSSGKKWLCDSDNNYHTCSVDAAEWGSLSYSKKYYCDGANWVECTAAIKGKVVVGLNQEPFFCWSDERGTFKWFLAGDLSADGCLNRGDVAILPRDSSFIFQNNGARGLTAFNTVLWNLFDQWGRQLICPSVRLAAPGEEISAPRADIRLPAGREARVRFP